MICCAELTFYIKITGPCRKDPALRFGLTLENSVKIDANYHTFCCFRKRVSTFNLKVIDTLYSIS